MKIKSVLLGAAFAGVALVAGAVSASATSYVYVGSWEVDQGPTWYGSPPNGPLAYTGQEAAALLFGGSASKYAISTVGPSVSTINFEAWYSVIGYYGNQNNGGSILAENFDLKYLGQFYGPTSGYPYGTPDAATSAYVRDNAVGSTFTNYAFSAVPETSTWVMMLAGFAGLGFLGYRRNKAATLAA